jgi:hypothetical protein
MPIPAKVSTRLAAGIKRFQPILENAKTRDVNESDTVTILTDILQEVFGYDKYSDITSEHSIRGTFCDLAVKHEGSLTLLIEAKAVNTELKDNFVKQAVDYASNQGIDWVILTNGIQWKVFKIIFTKPIENELLYEFDFQTLSHKNDEHLELLWMISKESWTKSLLGDYHAQKQALNKFSLSALILSDSIVEVLRREVRKLSPGIKVDLEEIRNVLHLEVLKRDCLEGEKADAAKKLISRAANRAKRADKEDKSPSESPEKHHEPVKHHDAPPANPAS